MKKRMLWARYVLLLAVVTLLGACGSAISLKPETPGDTATVSQQSGVASVQVGIAESMPPDRVKLLQKTKAAEELQKAVLASFAKGGTQKPGGVTLSAEIHVYRISNWGPSRMGVQVTVSDAAGEAVKSFEVQSATVRGGSTKTRTQRLAQDLVQKIIDNT